MLVAIAAGGVAALAVAAPAMATLPPGGVNESFNGSIELSGPGLSETLAGGVTLTFPPGRKVGTIRGAFFKDPSNFSAGSASVSGTAEYRRGDLLSLTFSLMRVNFAPRAAGPGQAARPFVASAVSTAPIVFPFQRVDDVPPNAPNTPLKALRNNHYKCYRVVKTFFRGQPNYRRAGILRVNDETGFLGNFPGPRPPFGPSEVCNPVSVTHTKPRQANTALISDTRPHLVAYKYMPPADPHQARVENPFGRYRLRARKLATFLVPSSEVAVTDGPQQRLRRQRDAVAGRPDLFACYTASGDRQRLGRLRLFDLFERSTHPAGSTVNGVCDPVRTESARDRGRFAPIRFPHAHLASYRVPGRARPAVLRELRFTNKFGPQRVQTGAFTRFLVPSAQRVCTRFRATGLGIPVLPVAGGGSAGTIDTVTFTPHEGAANGPCV